MGREAWNKIEIHTFGTIASHFHSEIFTAFNVDPFFSLFSCFSCCKIYFGSRSGHQSLNLQRDPPLYFPLIFYLPTNMADIPGSECNKRYMPLTFPLEYR